MLLALKIEQDDTNQGMQMAFQSWERQEMDSLRVCVPFLSLLCTMRSKN